MANVNMIRCSIMLIARKMKIKNYSKIPLHTHYNGKKLKFKRRQTVPRANEDMEATIILKYC
jgi:hypothetical protein